MRRTPFAAKRGTPAHAEELLAREIALGLVAAPAPAVTPAAPPAPVVDESLDIDELSELGVELDIRPVDAEPVVTPDADAEQIVELAESLMRPFTPVDEKDGSGLLALIKQSYARPLPDRALLAEREREYQSSAAYAAGIPFLTCRLFPSQSGMRGHHAHWRMVYWRDHGETRGAWRCIKCYPELEKFGATSARAVEVREIERRQESERAHAEAS